MHTSKPVKHGLAVWEKLDILLPIGRMTPTPSTTTRIAREYQGSSVAPIMESLPRHFSLTMWQCGSLHPEECTTMPGPSGGYDETRGCRPQNTTGVSIEIPFPALCEEHTHCDDDGRRADERARADQSSQRNDDEPTGLKATVYTSRPKNSKDEVCRRTDGQAMMKRHRQPRGPTPALPGGRGKEGSRFDPPKSGSATDNAKQNVWSNYDELQHAPPTHNGGGHHVKKAVPRPTTRERMIGRRRPIIARPTHTHGWAAERPDT